MVEMLALMMMMMVMICHWVLVTASELAVDVGGAVDRHEIKAEVLRGGVISREGAVRACVTMMAEVREMITASAAIAVAVWCRRWCCCCGSGYLLRC